MRRWGESVRHRDLYRNAGTVDALQWSAHKRPWRGRWGRVPPVRGRRISRQATPTGSYRGLDM